MMIQKKLAGCLLRMAEWLSPQLINSLERVDSPQPIEERLQHSGVTASLLSEQTVLITGAAGCIGQAIACEMASQGAKLMLLDINLTSCQALASRLGDCVIECIECDISNEKHIDQLIEKLTAESVDRQCINIDVLVHSAGIQFERSPSDPVLVNEWQQTHNTNVVGPTYLSQQLKSIQARGVNKSGLQSVLFISSIHQNSVVGWPSYSSSKAALGMVVNELAIEFASDGIRVNSIAPGWVAVDKRQQPKRSRYALLKRESIPPVAIGRAAVFLSSEYCSSHTTGATLTIDAAMSLFNHRVDIEYTV